MKVIKVPFSKGSMGKNPSADKAPDTILEQAKNFLLNEFGFAPQLEVEEVDVDQNDIEQTQNNIIQHISKLTTNSKVCLLGGDHSITYAGFKAFARKNPGAGLIILDAHPDCEHGTDVPSHEDFVRKLVSENILQKDRIILFGLRNWSGNEKQFLDNNKIRYFTMQQINITGIHDVLDGLTETLRQWPVLYISIDIDVADPSCAPGTGYTEPGGLTARQLIYAIQRMKLLKNLKMVDIVEVGPDKDVNDMTSTLAAKILVELA